MTIAVINIDEFFGKDLKKKKWILFFPSKENKILSTN